MKTTTKISYPYNLRLFSSRKKQEYSDVILVSESTYAFINRFPQTFVAEMEYARNIGVVPLKKGTREFQEWLKSHAVMKWVYTIHRELYIAVGVSGTASHAVLSNGEPVFSAGMARWVGNTLEINCYTGHFQTSQNSLNFHAHTAWENTGVAIRIVNWRENQAALIEENRRMFSVAESLLRN